MLPNCQTFCIIAFIGFACNWQFGYQITYINTASKNFYEFANKAFKANHNGTSLINENWSTQWSWIVASFYPGTFFGFVLVPFSIRRVGIRKSLLFSTYPSIVGLIIQLFVRFAASFNEHMFMGCMIVGRFLVGVQAGASLCLLPLFIIEASPILCRPFLSSLQQVFQALSTLIGFLLGSDSILPLGENKIEWLQIFGLLPMCAFIIFVFFLPDTPFYIIENQDENNNLIEDQDSKLYKSIELYYGDLTHLSIIQQEACERWTVDLTKNECDYLKKLENFKGLIIGIFAAISLAFTADDVIDAFSSQLLYRTVGATSNLPEIITIGLGLWLLITSVGGAFLIDRFGRKRLLIIGLLGTSISNALAATGASFDSVIVVTVGFIFTKSFIGFGAGAPAWFLTSELVSPRVTCVCQSISTGCLLMMTGFVTLFFLQLEVNVGDTLAILILSSIPAFTVAIILILFLPETKDYTHTEISTLITSHFFSGLPTRMDKKISMQKRPSLHRFMNARNYASYGSLRNAAHIHH